MTEKGAGKATIPWAQPCLHGKERDYVRQALDSTWISAGEFVDRFEADFSRQIGTKHAVTTSSGTAALHLALVAAGIGQGDEVIIPGFTFAAPANMVLQTGAEPVFVDIEPRTWCIDIAEVKKSITKKTKAIIPVHVYGNVCDMEGLTEIARDNGIHLIEDVAEAVFSKYKGRSAGSFGDLGCFSFHAAKTITMGEGGAVLTNDDRLCDRLRLLRSHGMREGQRYWHDLVGYNYRLTNLQAALGCAQLENVDNIVKDKARVYNRYRDRLSGMPGIEFQYIPEEVEAVVWAVAIRIDQEHFMVDRDRLMSELLKEGIETRPGFYAFSVMPLYEAAPLPVAESVGRNVISLPSYSSLPDEDIDLVCSQLRSLMR